LPKENIIVEFKFEKAAFSCVSGCWLLFVLELVELFQVSQTRVNDTKVFGQVKNFTTDFNDFFLLNIKDWSHIGEFFLGFESCLDLF